MTTEQKMAYRVIFGVGEELRIILAKTASSQSGLKLSLPVERLLADARQKILQAEREMECIEVA